MPTQKKHLLLFSFFLATCLCANTGVAKDFAQSKSTEKESPSKSTPDKKSPAKEKNKSKNLTTKQPITKSKAPSKKTLKAGYCITNNKLISLIESNCKRRKGSYFSNKKQAQNFLAANQNGFCLKEQTAGKGDQFFRNRQQAKSALARVNGFCVDDGAVIGTSYGKCHNKHGIFFTNRGAAHKKAATNKKIAARKAKSSRSGLTPASSIMRNNRLSGKQHLSTGTINRKIPGTTVSDRLDERLGNKRIKDRMASMQDAQAAKDAGLASVDSGAGRKTDMTDLMTGEPLTLGRTLRDPITGDEIGRASMERNHYDEIGRISGDRQHDGSDHTDEMREAGRRGGKGMAMDDASDAGSPKDTEKSKTPSTSTPAKPGEKVKGNTDIDEDKPNTAHLTFDEVVNIVSGKNPGFTITRHNGDDSSISFMKNDEFNQVLVTRTMVNGAQTKQLYTRGEEPGKVRWVDPDDPSSNTEHPDEQRGSGNDKKRKALTYMDLAGNQGSNARNAEEKNRKKQIFTKDDLAGNPNPQNAERKGKSRALPDAIMTGLTLSGTPVEEDTNFGEIDPHNPSGSRSYSSSSNRQQVQGGASLPSTKSNKNLATSEQQEEPVVVPDNQ